MNLERQGEGFSGGWVACTPPSEVHAAGQCLLFVGPLTTIALLSACGNEQFACTLKNGCGLNWRRELECLERPPA